ncbi:MAG: 2-oxoacid:acceptor oxidoreductase family protein [Candidatus Hodarchaeota archaeon]
MINEEVLLLGTGGQGVVLFGRLIGQAATAAGYFSTQKATYSSAVRGDMPVSSSIIISEKPIRYPFVRHADIFIAMNGTGIETYEKYLDNLSLFLYDPLNVSKTYNPKPIPVPATETARKLGNSLVANTVMLGAFAHVTPFILPDVFIDTLKKNIRERHFEVNLKAFEAGLHLMQT